MSYKFEDVAKWFLAKGNKDISPKKLQKLVYYAYAWTLTLLNDSSDELENKLFEDGKFEAWIHGPVIRKLYAMYADYGFEDIPEKPEKPKFSKDVEDVLDQVWEVYGDYSSNQLESITHQEEPWQKARKGFSPLQNCDNIISDKDIFNYYIQRAG